MQRALSSSEEADIRVQRTARIFASSSVPQALVFEETRIPWLQTQAVHILGPTRPQSRSSLQTPHLASDPVFKLSVDPSVFHELRVCHHDILIDHTPNRKRTDRDLPHRSRAMCDFAKGCYILSSAEEGLNFEGFVGAE